MKKLLICNHKMFLTYDEAIILKNKMNDINFDDVDLVVCPSYLNFDVFKDYTLGAQNCFYEDKGAYTGEISSYDLNLRKIKYSIVGHSDRRKYETNEEINLKVKSLLKNSMTPILCIGETKMDKELRRTSEVLKKQLYSALDGVVLDKSQELVIAYEPVWAIGTGNNLSKEQIEDTLMYLRKLLDLKEIHNYKLLYGGSVNKSNINFILNDIVDGYLLGNASINDDELKYITKCIK